MDPFSLDHIIDSIPSLNCKKQVGQIRLELMTPALSERCSNQLSYCPISIRDIEEKKVIENTRAFQKFHQETSFRVFHSADKLSCYNAKVCE